MQEYCEENTKHQSEKKIRVKMKYRKKIMWLRGVDEEKKKRDE